MFKHALTYHDDSSLLFERIAHLPWAMFLDSGQTLDANTGKPGSQYGRYDILVAEPFITLVTCGLTTTITQNGTSIISTEDPFKLLKNLLGQYRTTQATPASLANTPAFTDADLPLTDAALPFTGGALGYFAYDLAHRIEKLPNNAIAALTVPEMMVGIYDWALVIDHREKTSTLVSNGFNADTKKNWRQLVAKFSAPYSAAATTFAVTSAIDSNLPEPQYRQAFAKIKAYIEAGDCYQVNLAQRFSAMVKGDSWQAYKKLRTVSPAPFMAFMQLPLNDTEQFQVLSNSPERFIQIKGDHVETRPIKGTRPRFKDLSLDSNSANELLTSLKDKAENVMIVDLLRNDLSKCCQQVRVTKLFQLQSFANVHHLVSIIVGKLHQNKTAVDILRACFPGGSITGAPKLRAMQIIDELEPHQRGLYCGAIGYIGFDGDMDTNIAIRSAVISKNTLSFYAGGGIVADSDCSKEYAETLDKASSFTKVIQYFMRP